MYIKWVSLTRIGWFKIASKIVISFWYTLDFYFLYALLFGPVYGCYGHNISGMCLHNWKPGISNQMSMFVWMFLFFYVPCGIHILVILSFFLNFFSTSGLTWQKTVTGCNELWTSALQFPIPSRYPSHHPHIHFYSIHYPQVVTNLITSPYPSLHPHVLVYRTWYRQAVTKLGHPR